MADYTEHYQLHQWQPQDKFLRTDFNEDLQKIDTALNGLAGDLAQKAAQSDLDEVRALATQSRFTKLREVNITDYVTTAELDLSDVAWSQWDKVHVDIIATNGQQGSVYINSDASNNFLCNFGGSLTEEGVFHPRLTFYPNFQTSRFVTATFNGTPKFYKDTYNTLLKLVFSANMNSGIYLVLWGEK